MDNDNSARDTLKASPFAIVKSPAMWIFLAAVVAALLIGRYVQPTWTVEKVARDVKMADDGELFYTHKGKAEYIGAVVPYGDAQLHPDRIDQLNSGNLTPAVTREFVYEVVVVEPDVDVDSASVSRTYFELIARRHWRYWSLLPAVLAVALCWLTREPLTSLTGGIIVGAIILGKYDITDSVLLDSLSTRNAAGVLLLYLWLLGGLMGIWGRTGAAKAFADLMTRRFVRGPRSAKLVAWFLGVAFFQGGTISTVLVGTCVKPIADRERISHEELAYIVDSTASPIASQLAFNAWPGYVQAFIFVAGVPWLITEADRITFFFKSVPFCFYAIFAVLFTFLLSIEKTPFIGRRMRAAITRARQTNQLDAPNAQPLSAAELQNIQVPTGYRPHVIDFFLPLATLIGIAIGTFIYSGSPQVRWAFAAALLLAMLLAVVRGMSLANVVVGIISGMKGVMLGSVILLLAITIGTISKETGGALYLVELLGEYIPYFLLPVMLQILTIIIAFSTGTSWGTYAVAFPLAMPLAWAVANASGLAHPEFFMTICFAAVMDGSVYGDQCSPISDTTVLSSMCCGCDLMDHVKTQIPQASVAAALAAVCWTAVAFLAA